MSQLSLYFDEDAMNSRLVAALRSRGALALTVLDTGAIGRPDEEQLALATELACVLFTFNVPDFHRLHNQWLEEGRHHTGIILASQQRLSIGEQLRRILRLRATVSAEQMRNRIEFLSHWG